MIDTDKYEGHTPAPWRVENGSIHAKADWWSGAGDMIFFSKRHGQDANSQLIADAPLLLAEVKRLYEMMDVLASFNIVKNAEQGFTQREWVEFVELAKRGAYEAQMEEEE